MEASSESPAPQGIRIRPHTRENLARGENRINSVLFGAHAIPEFWLPCCRLLGLAADASIMPVVIHGQQIRPDFLFYEHGEPAGWIEVELGGADNRQNEVYRSKLQPPRVVSLVGPAANRSGAPSLERVAELAREVAVAIGATNRPGANVLQSLAQLIKDHVKPETRRPSLREIPPRLLGLEWFGRAVAPLLDLQKHGFVVNRTIGHDSLSLRLKHGPSIRCKDDFALITQRDPDHFEVPTPHEMDWIFRAPLKGVVKLWEALLDRAFPCWAAHVDGRKRISIDTRIVETRADEFAVIYAALRDCLVPLGAK